MAAYSKTRLYITVDIYHDNVWFARTDCDRFARIEYKGDYTYVWFYKYKYLLTFKTLTESLKVIENTFIRWFYETYIKQTRSE